MGHEEVIMSKSLLVALAILYSASLWSFSCYFTLAKDTCWSAYNVTVKVKDAITSKTLLTVFVPKNTSWVREEFTCQPAQKLQYTATFTPKIWEKDAGKTYLSTNIWNLPAQIKPGEAAWNVTVCYPNSFSGVPMPPEATAVCSCNLNAIPSPPKK